MESEAKYTLIGSLIVALVVAVVTALLWLSGDGTGDNGKYYTIYFREQDLSGVQKDSNVTMKGVKVGSVLSYGVSERNIEEVKVLIKVLESTPVKTDTQAIINRNVLTGLATIGLSGGTQDAPVLTEKPKGEPYPVIAEGRTDLAQLASSLPGLLDNMNETVGRIGGFFSDENLKSVNTILANFANVSDSLAKSEKQISTTVDSLSKFIKDLESLSSSLRRAVEQSEGDLDQIATDMGAAMKQLRATSENLDTYGRELSRSVANAADIFTLELSRIAQDISRAATAFSTTAEGFEDPKSLILGPRKEALGPGEELRKK